MKRPKASYRGDTFVDANGERFEVVSGKMPTPDWPHGSGSSLALFGMHDYDVSKWKYPEGISDES